MPAYARKSPNGYLEISFDQKPEEAVRSRLKKAHFLWDPQRVLWYAPETPERLALIQQLCAESTAEEDRLKTEPSLRDSLDKSYGLSLSLQDLIHADLAAQMEWTRQLKAYVNYRLSEDNTAHDRPAVGCVQEDVWLDCLQFIQKTLKALKPEQQCFKLAFEYTMPGSVYKRPDIILLTDKKVIILEFKKKLLPTIDAHKDDIMQLTRYREWIENHHLVTKERKMVVKGYLVCTPDQAVGGMMRSVEVLNRTTFLNVIEKELRGACPCDFCEEWLESPRTEMPDMLQAIGCLYRENRIPYGDVM